MCGAIEGVQKERNKVIMKRYVYIIRIFRTQDISKGFEISKGLEIQKKTRDCFRIQNSHGLTFTYAEVDFLAYFSQDSRFF